MRTLLISDVINFSDKPDTQRALTCGDTKPRSGARLLTLVPLAVLAMPFSAATAQQAVKLGDTNLTPTLRLDYVTVDNTFRSADDPVGTSGLIVSPSLSWVADRRLLALSAGYDGRYGAYDESARDFDDHRIAFGVDSAPGTRHRLNGRFLLNRSHEEVGTGQTRFLNNPDDQIETTASTLRLGYVYGAASAKGNVGTGIIFSAVSYDNFDEITDGDDYSAVRPYVTFSYRLSPDTRLVAETRYGVVDYDDDRRDRSEISVLGGFDLKATSRTGGSVRLGVTNASYDTQGIEDSSTFVADVDLFFSPRTFSRFSVSFNRDLNTVDNDAAGARQSTVDKLGISWSQEWSSRLSSRLAYELERFDRTCPNNGTDTGTIALEVGVNIRRWVSVGLSASNSQRTVGDCSGLREPGAADYDVNNLGAFVFVTL